MISISFVAMLDDVKSLQLLNKEWSVEIFDLTNNVTYQIQQTLENARLGRPIVQSFEPGTELKIVATANNYQPRTLFTTVMNNSGGQTISIPFSQKNDIIKSILIQFDAIIQGKRSSAKGRTVTIIFTHKESGQSITITTKSGEIVFYNQAEGGYDISVSCPGFISQNLYKDLYVNTSQKRGIYDITLSMALVQDKSYIMSPTPTQTPFPTPTQTRTPSSTITLSKTNIPIRPTPSAEVKTSYHTGLLPSGQQPIIDTSNPPIERDLNNGLFIGSFINNNVLCDYYLSEKIMIDQKNQQTELSIRWNAINYSKLKTSYSSDGQVNTIALYNNQTLFNTNNNYVLALLNTFRISKNDSSWYLPSLIELENILTKIKNNNLLNGLKNYELSNSYYYTSCTTKNFNRLGQLDHIAMAMIDRSLNKQHQILYKVITSSRSHNGNINGVVRFIRRDNCRPINVTPTPTSTTSIRVSASPSAPPIEHEYFNHGGRLLYEKVTRTEEGTWTCSYYISPKLTISPEMSLETPFFWDEFKIDNIHYPDYNYSNQLENDLIFDSMDGLLATNKLLRSVDISSLSHHHVLRVVSDIRKKSNYEWFIPSIKEDWLNIESHHFLINNDPLYQIEPTGYFSSSVQPTWFTFDNQKTRLRFLTAPSFVLGQTTYNNDVVFFPSYGQNIKFLRLLRKTCTFTPHVTPTPTPTPTLSTSIQVSPSLSLRDDMLLCVEDSGIYLGQRTHIKEYVEDGNKQTCVATTYDYFLSPRLSLIDGVYQEFKSCWGSKLLSSSIKDVNAFVFNTPTSNERLINTCFIDLVKNRSNVNIIRGMHDDGFFETQIQIFNLLFNNVTNYQNVDNLINAISSTPLKQLQYNYPIWMAIKQRACNQYQWFVPNLSDWEFIYDHRDLLVDDRYKIDSGTCFWSSTFITSTIFYVTDQQQTHSLTKGNFFTNIRSYNNTFNPYKSNSTMLGAMDIDRKNYNSPFFFFFDGQCQTISTRLLRRVPVFEEIISCTAPYPTPQPSHTPYHYDMHIDQPIPYNDGWKSIIRDRDGRSWGVIIEGDGTGRGGKIISSDDGRGGYSYFTTPDDSGSGGGIYMNINKERIYIGDDGSGLFNKKRFKFRSDGSGGYIVDTIDDQLSGGGGTRIIIPHGGETGGGFIDLEPDQYGQFYVYNRTRKQIPLNDISPNHLSINEQGIIHGGLFRDEQKTIDISIHSDGQGRIISSNSDGSGGYIIETDDGVRIVVDESGKIQIKDDGTGQGSGSRFKIISDGSGGYIIKTLPGPDGSGGGIEIKLSDLDEEGSGVDIDFDVDPNGDIIIQPVQPDFIIPKVTPTPSVTTSRSSIQVSMVPEMSPTPSATPEMSPTPSATPEMSPTPSATPTIYEGNIWSWGTNNYGQLGLGDNIERLVPTQLPTNIIINELSSGNGHVIGRTDTNTLVGWGYNGDGRLALGDTTNRNIITNIDSSEWLSISSGVNYIIGIKTDGSLWGIGTNYYGQLGLGDVVARTEFVQIGTDTDWAYISSDERVSAMIKTNGTLWVMGNNEFGGLGIEGIMESFVPVQVGTDTNWKLVNPGYNHTTAIKTDGSLWSWGMNFFGQQGHDYPNSKNTPSQVGTDTNWAYVKPGMNYTIALKTDGSLWSWGYNYYGQLGRGVSSMFESTPQQVGSDMTWASLATRWDATIAIKTDGTMWGWGYNYYGQLGLGDKINRLSPTQIGTKNNWKTVVCGITYTIAIEE